MTMRNEITEKRVEKWSITKKKNNKKKRRRKGTIMSEEKVKRPERIVRI